MSLSAEAVSRLRVVQKQILKTPEFYDQDLFAKPARCGTICCLAGWLHYNEVGEKEHLRVARLYASGKPGGYFDFSDYARRLLGIDELSLFAMGEDWPEPFNFEYLAATTDLQRAQIAVRRIDHFIEKSE